MTARQLYRQGDVLVVPVPTIPDGLRPVPRDAGRVVLAYGEVTGHAHAITDAAAELLAAPQADIDQRFLRLTAGVQLRHEEHATIDLPPGDYRVVRQREYTSADMAPAYVAD